MKSVERRLEDSDSCLGGGGTAPHGRDDHLVDDRIVVQEHDPDRAGGLQAAHHARHRESLDDGDLPLHRREVVTRVHGFCRKTVR